MKNLGIAAVLIALVVGTALTVWGLADLVWPQALPWSGREGLGSYLTFLLVCTLVVFSGTRWANWNPLFVGGLVAATLAVMAGALWALLSVVSLTLSSAAMGRIILRFFRLDPLCSVPVITFLVGIGAYGTVVGLIAHYPLSYPGVYGVALIAPLLLEWRFVLAQCSRLLASSKAQVKDDPTLRRLDVCIAVVALVYVAVALMPEVGHDALAMHLFIPAQLAYRHQWGFDANTYVWAVMPMLGDWIFSIGYMLAGETAVRLINIGFILIIGWLVRDMVLWAGGSAIAVRWGVLIFLSTPLTFTEGSSLFVESIWSAFTIAGLMATLQLGKNGGASRLYLPLAGLVLGYALASKAITLTILPVLLLILFCQYKSWLKTSTILYAAMGIGLFFVIGIIPYLTAWWLTSNPVFPFFNGVFKSVYYPAVNFESASIFGKGLSWDVLYRATFESGKYLEANAGASGFQWLILFVPTIIALFAGKQFKGITLLVSGVLVIALVFQSVSYFRYAFPAFAIMAASSGVVLGSAILERFVAIRILSIAAGIVIFLNMLFLNAGAQYGDFPIQSLGDDSRRAQYLSWRLPIRLSVELVNNLNAGRNPVAIFATPLVGELSADALHANWYNFKFQNEINAATTEQDLANVLLNRNVDLIILDANWRGGAEKHALINRVADTVAEFGSISVLRLRADYRFKTELLHNPDFKTIEGWSLAPGVKYDDAGGIMQVRVDASASQAVAVVPGGRYRNLVVARCAKMQTTGRVQINWLDSGGKFINAAISTFDCAPDWQEHEMSVTAPTNASLAFVYVSGHTPIPLEYKSNSLRH